MKKIKLLTILALPTLINVSVIPLTSCGCSNANTGNLSKTVEMKIHLIDPTTGNYTESDTTIKMYHFEGQPMGYVKLAEFYTNAEVMKINMVEKDRKSTITNNFNSGYQANCVIDYANQTITFDNYQEFIDTTANSHGPMTDLVSQGGKYFVQSKTTSNFKKGNSKTIDLKKYSIKPIWYNSQGYIPFELVRNVLNYPYALTVNEQAYALSNFAYNGKGLYQMPDYRYYSSDTQIALNKTVKADGGNYFSKDYMEYCYNLIALTLDFRFGMVERVSRANGHVIKYQDKDIYEIMKPYHDGIVSTDDNVSSQTIRKLMREKFDDGGHTAYTNLNAFSTVKTSYDEMAGDEMKYASKVSSGLATARSNAHHAPETGKMGDFETYQKTGSSEEIAYMTFDNFNEPTSISSWSDKEIAAGRELPSNTTKDNCGDDLLRLTMYANNQIKNDSNIKSLVLDMSLNGGGAGYIEHFVASWICGGITQKVWNPHTNDYCEYTCYADLNNDGQFDDNDTLSNNIKVFVITSTTSFSCGNILPCNIRDQRDGATFIGHNSGGGPCIVDTNISIGANSMMQISSNTHLLRYSSTIDNPITMDEGCWTDYYIDEVNNPAGFYDRNNINNKIWGIS